jgi:hypothetical protein
MTDYTELVKRLSQMYAPLATECADAITALMAERDEANRKTELLAGYMAGLEVYQVARNAALEEAAKRAAAMEQYTVAAAIRALKDKPTGAPPAQQPQPRSPK